jgi:cell volume regulation protein A
MGAVQVDRLMLIGAILILFAIASNKFSSRIGMPAVVVFIGLGMLAGSEGVGGIAFENYLVANAIGTIALALILFDGGLRTTVGALRVAWRPALTLATLGVVITSLITGLAASRILGIPWMAGILLGSIVGSTDAAAVFSVLRSRGARLPRRLGSTLEVESGSNDPMAVFLTVGLIEVVLGRMEPGLPLLGLFALQMGVGSVAGLLVGRGGVALNRRINLDAAGLYPVMMGAVGFLAYGIAVFFGGSGFLAVYVSGIMLGNHPIVFKRGILLFSDGMAWLAQIVMFTMLGLLSFPSRLLDVAPQGIAIAAVLILIARPAAVVVLLPFFRFNVREIALVAWVGLRGAVPIILATYLLLAGVPDGRLLFDVVFFVVLASAVTQGWTLPAVAALLRLQRPAAPEPPVTLEITSLRHVPSDVVDYLVIDGSKADGRPIRELALPDGAVVALIARGQEIIPPRGSTRLAAGDHVSLVMRPEVRGVVDRIFARRGHEKQHPMPVVEFPVSARMRIGELMEFYGVEVEASPDITLEDLVRHRIGDPRPAPGVRVELGNIFLCVREVSAEGIDVIGIQILPPP